MERDTTVIEIIFSAIDELNQQLPQPQRLAKSVDTPLAGESATLDSVALVNLIVITEQKLEDHFNVSLSLAEDGLGSTEEGPFQCVGTLGDHISLLLERNHG
jgi:hypothetical protein